MAERGFQYLKNLYQVKFESKESNYLIDFKVFRLRISIHFNLKYILSLLQAQNQRFNILIM